jgi:hypothetical protein
VTTLRRVLLARSEGETLIALPRNMQAHLEHIRGFLFSTWYSSLVERASKWTTMPEITPNVSFDTIAREWRCKWSADADKASLVKAQDALASILAEVKLSAASPAPPAPPRSGNTGACFQGISGCARAAEQRVAAEERLCPA